MSYTGMAMQIIGSELQGWANTLDSWAVADTMNAGLKTWTDFQTEAMNEFYGNLPQFGAKQAGQDIAKGAASAQSDYGKLQSVPNQLGKAPKTSGFVKANAQQMNRNAANLRGYGDWQHQVGKVANQQNYDLAGIKSNARGWADVLFPLDIQRASHSNDTMSTIGSMFSAAGSMMGGGGSMVFNKNPSASMPQYSQMPNSDFGNFNSDNPSNFMDSSGPGMAAAAVQV